MIRISTWVEMASYLSGTTDPDIKRLLELRRDQLIEYGELTELGPFILIEPGDTMAEIDAAVGWPILMDGAPTFEWVQRHGSLFEMPTVLSDSGAGHVLIVPDIEGIDQELLALCRAYA